VRRYVGSDTGYRDVRLHEFGCLRLRATERRCASARTFEPLELQAYNIMAWRFGRPKRELNFPDVQSRHETEFLAPGL
jgi:hypothetical protein